MKVVVVWNAYDIYNVKVWPKEIINSILVKTKVWRLFLLKPMDEGYSCESQINYEGYSFKSQSIKAILLKAKIWRLFLWKPIKL